MTQLEIGLMVTIVLLVLALFVAIVLLRNQINLRDRVIKLSDDKIKSITVKGETEVARQDVLIKDMMDNPLYYLRYKGTQKSCIADIDSIGRIKFRKFTRTKVEDGNLENSLFYMQTTS